jgi:uncharacterized protein (DUF488 family)
MPLTMTSPLGIGYQGRDVASFIDELAGDRVEVVFDVRLTPISRKKGFSKRLLAAHLRESGIGYEHLPSLGNPKWNRKGFAGTAEELAEARRHYATCLESEDARSALDRIGQLATHQRVALLCFEADDQRCHRKVVLDALNVGG